MTFAEDYKDILNTVSEDVERVNTKLGALFELRTPIHKELQCFLNSPSKRIRSVAAFLFLRANGIEITDEQVELQVIVELIHNASLIHDDVIDGDLKRRGESTINCDFGNRLAIISGDYLLAFVMKKLTALNSCGLFNLFARTLENMCSGEIQQHLSMNSITGIDEYIEKSYLKTGSLFETAIEGGLLLSGQDKSAEFGKNFGIAFQIRDDLLNVLSAESKDINSGVFNAPVIFSGGKSLTAAGIEKTKDLLNNYLKRAGICIADLAESKYKSALLELLELLRNE